MGKQCKYPFCIAEAWKAIPENVDWQGQEGDCLCGNRVKRDVDIYCNKCGRNLLWSNVTYSVPLEIKELDIDGEKPGVRLPCYEDWRKQIAGNKYSICGFEYFGDSLPSIDPVKHGKWLRMQRCNMDGDLTYCANCSVCGVEVVLWEHNSFCPHCGAAMENG